MSQPQSQPSSPPQGHQVEQHLVAAGVPQQALDQAKAHGLSGPLLLQLLSKFLPIILQVIEQLSASGTTPAGAGHPPTGVPRQPSGQHAPGVVSDPDEGHP